MIYFRIKDKNDNVLYDSVPPSLISYCLNKNSNCLINVPISGKIQEFRIGHISNEKGMLLVLTDEIKYVNGKTVFGKFLKYGNLLLEALVIVKKDVTEKYNNQTRELIHNLTTLNGHNIQEIFALIPEHVLTKQINEQTSAVNNIITKNVESTSKTFLRLAKNNLTMKVEFSVFKKLMENEPHLTKGFHNIREIILRTLQIFSQDFNEQKIDLQLDTSDQELFIDFETITVCLYYIIENAAKYCLPRSVLKIFLIKDDTYFKILFDMISVEVKSGEESHLFDYGFCGVNAKKLNKNGSGIGLYRAYKTLLLNNASIEFKSRVTANLKRHDGCLYEHNAIEIKFPLEERGFK